MNLTYILILVIPFKFNLVAQIENDSATIAFYPFDGNGNDISGNGFNATLIGSLTYITDWNGNENSVFSFDGSSNYFTVNNVNDTFKPSWKFVKAYDLAGHLIFPKKHFWWISLAK